jgi:hypothetical protein
MLLGLTHFHPEHQKESKKRAVNGFLGTYMGSLLRQDSAVREVNPLNPLPESVDSSRTYKSGQESVYGIIDW